MELNYLSYDKNKFEQLLKVETISELINFINQLNSYVSVYNFRHPEKNERLSNTLSRIHVYVNSNFFQLKNDLYLEISQQYVPIGLTYNLIRRLMEEVLFNFDYRYYKLIKSKNKLTSRSGFITVSNLLSRIFLVPYLFNKEDYKDLIADTENLMVFANTEIYKRTDNKKVIDLNKISMISKFLIAKFFIDFLNDEKKGLEDCINLISEELAFFEKNIENDNIIEAIKKLNFDSSITHKELLRNDLTFVGLIKGFIEFPTFKAYKDENLYMFDLKDFEFGIIFSTNEADYISYLNIEDYEKYIENSVSFLYYYFSIHDWKHNSPYLKYLNTLKYSLRELRRDENFKYWFLSLPKEKIEEILEQFDKKIATLDKDLSEFFNNPTTRKILIIIILYELSNYYRGEEIDTIKVLEEIILLLIQSKKRYQ